MFSVGDKIVYPIYGAGIVEDLQEKSVEGIQELYYVIKISTGNLKIVLSTKKAETLGLRPVNRAEDVIKIIKGVKAIPMNMPDNWNQRYKENMEKIKSGNLSLVAEVMRNLLAREKERGLSNIEKKMLNSAKQIIVSELILSQDIEKEKAEEVVKNALSC